LESQPAATIPPYWKRFETGLEWPGRSGRSICLPLSLRFSGKSGIVASLDASHWLAFEIDHNILP
jgi:hypothetical protein